MHVADGLVGFDSVGEDVPFAREILPSRSVPKSELGMEEENYKQ